MGWTEERVEQLKRLWAEGLSASQIAGRLGGVTRNAVIGKVHRLNLPGRAKSGGSSTPARTKRPAPAAPRPQSFQARPAPRPAPRTANAALLKDDADTELVVHQTRQASTDVVVPIARRLELTQLTDRTCKWPIGDPLTDEFHFCGNDAGDVSPYCTYHARLAYQPTGERRRAR